MEKEFTLIEKTAVEAAQKAGIYLLENYGKLNKDAIDEKSKNDFVTVVDKTSEKLIVEHLLSIFPDHGILAEEGNYQQSSSDFRWIIDPLDGTLNFIRKIPVFSISIALQQRDKLLAGVVFNPMTNEIFTAISGKGARLNAQPIQVSLLEDFSRALLATGFPHHAKFQLPKFITSLSEVFAKTAGIRRLGSAALDLCYTACGRFDGFWELGLNPWDIAAGSLIVEEAGGIVSDFTGEKSYLKSGSVLAAPTAIHQFLKEILSHYF